jgi:anionic cell wall polymer biosynthesis LytR-Cps2A-Psr (LCP) family protein
MGNSSARIAPGTYTMDGTTALAYVRERYTLPGGDFDRVKRQQNWIRAILRGAANSGAVTDPQKLYDLLSAAASSLATDDAFTIEEMRDLAFSLRGAGPGGARFLTVPLKGTGWSPDHKQSIVLLDTAKARGLWAAVKHDTVAGWLADEGYPTLGQTVS